MKKIHLILVATSVLLTSCSKDVLKDAFETEAYQKAIGFSTFSNMATRGDVTDKANLEFYHNTFAVYGTKRTSATAPAQYVFGAAAAAAAVNGTTCTYDAGNFYGTDWKYSPVRFWDRQAKYYFVAYAPAAAPIRYKYASTTADVSTTGNEFVTTTPYVLYGENIQQSAPSTAEILKGFTASAASPAQDIDILVSDVEGEIDGAAYSASVNLDFHHILAKLNVTVAKTSVLDDAVVEVSSIAIDKLLNKGAYSSKTYNSSTKTSGWSTAAYTSSTYTLSFAGTATALNASDGNKIYFVESLVMPQTVADGQSTLTLTYSITTGTDPDTHTESYTRKIDLQDAFPSFFDGYNYTLNLVIDPAVITFDASVYEWATSTEYEKTLG